MANQISPGITWLSDVFALIRVDVRSFHHPPFHCVEEDMCSTRWRSVAISLFSHPLNAHYEKEGGGQTKEDRIISRKVSLQEYYNSVDSDLSIIHTQISALRKSVISFHSTRAIRLARLERSNGSSTRKRGRGKGYSASSCFQTRG